VNDTASGSGSYDNATFHVGDLLVDVGQQRVTRANTEIALPNLSFQLLVALVRAAPNVLNNDLLMERVWPGLVVSPETVAKRVNLLREALGDSAQEPRYIAGVRGRGYRLVAAVSAASRSPGPPVTQPDDLPARVTVARDSPKIASKPSLNWWLVSSALLLAALAIAIGIRTAEKPRAVDAQANGGIPLHNAVAIGARARTVAVLPFDDISVNAADAYLAQGLSEMILNRLSRIDGLSVIARNSSFALATKGIDSSEIGRRLNCGYLISGSVQRDANRLRVTAQLVDAAAGTLVWSAHIDRHLPEIFAIEDEIAEQVAATLSARLGDPEPSLPGQGRSANLEAHLDFLRGRALLGRSTVTQSEAAVPYFEKAIALDPNFASAYSSLYDARMQAAAGRQEDLTRARQRYRHLIDRALELDANLGAAYFARAMWSAQPHDVTATPANPLIAAQEQDFRRGAALDPSNGRGFWAYAEFADGMLEHHEEGRTLLKRALWVDPMSPGAHLTDAIFALEDRGVRVSEQKNLKVLELDPDFVPALQRYGTFRWLFDGQLAEAIQILEHGIALDPGNPWLRYAAVEVYLDLGEMKAARDVAASTPIGARTMGLFALRDGDWRRAGLAAYDEASWTTDDDYCKNMLASEAIRDYAWKTGELSRAIAFIKRKYYLGDNPASHLDPCSFRPAVHLSQLMAAAGEVEQAAALRRSASTWLDSNAVKYFTDAGRLRAEILLLDGKRDAALSELAGALRSGVSSNWWYTIEVDPSWLPLHGDRRFQAIAADLRRHVEAQRSQLEELRRQGAVPRRG
jgi:TolB-like protein/DNA-binding winged helix-turn-helix (wHTH) protein